MPVQHTILIADDVPVFRDLIGGYLGPVGRVVDAADGREALQRAQNERPDLVVTDLEMPGLDGAELCRALKQDPELREIPVMILLPGDRAADRACAERAGADGVLPKPIHRSELVAAATRLLTG